ncbi:hypothetical protein AB1Y20_019944 [Prymnesium parvum]|uniref:V-type proton ATPase proteolipid subunit n=1 Tax=Prymnesium parvum TaxID=97485 RepID=A0AB34JVU0_PRYPA
MSAPPAPPLMRIVMDGPVPELCPTWAPLLGFLGAMFGLVFSSIGAAWGTGKAGQAISAIGVKRPELVFKNIIPVVMAGVLSIYGLIVSVIIGTQVKHSMMDNLDTLKFSDYSMYSAFSHFFAGVTCGLTSMSCGICIGIAGDAGVRSVAAISKNQPAKGAKLYVGMVLIQGTASALGMYGLIVGLIITTNTSSACK